MLLVAAVCFLVGSAVSAQERAFDTTVCGLLLHPEKYNEGLVSVEALITVGPEEFLAHDAHCGDALGQVWLQFGGNVESPGSTANPKRPSGKPRTVEGLELPLSKDRDYDALQKLLQTAQKSGQAKMLRATLIGKYFAGKPTKTVGGEVRTGYGHLGCCSLLVIEEVGTVTDGLEGTVDFSPVPAAPLRALRKGCTVMELMVPPHEDEEQLLLKSLEDEYQYLHDPKLVAARAIAVQTDLTADEAEKRLQTESAGLTLAIYTWTSDDGARSYRITVNKPYWLLQTVGNGDSIIWAPKQIVRNDCPPLVKKGF